MCVYLKRDMLLLYAVLGPIKEYIPKNKSEKKLDK